MDSSPSKGGILFVPRGLHLFVFDFANSESRRSPVWDRRTSIYYCLLPGLLRLIASLSSLNCQGSQSNQRAGISKGISLSMNNRDKYRVQPYNFDCSLRLSSVEDSNLLLNPL